MDCKLANCATIILHMSSVAQTGKFSRNRSRCSSRMRSVGAHHRHFLHRHNRFEIDYSQNGEVTESNCRHQPLQDVIVLYKGLKLLVICHCCEHGQLNGQPATFN